MPEQTIQPSDTKTIVILYTELAGYLLACVNALAGEFGVQVHLVHYPVNKVAPFRFNASDTGVHFYNRDSFSEKDLETWISDLKPGLIYCAGWSDKLYLRLVKRFSGKIPTLLGFDNRWEGSLRQRASTLYARFFIKPFFDYAFVPGIGQKIFARKLGFPEASIHLGAYSADIPLFTGMYERHHAHKIASFPRKLIFVGRYVKEKGIEDLYEVFTHLPETISANWELWCLGTGPLTFPEHPRVRHMGFVQPSDLETYIGQTGVFVLPSLFEPWGVVAHEFAAAGFPMILSNRIGAAEVFLKEGENGFVFEAGNKEQLRQKLSQLMTSSDQILSQMARSSHQLAFSITPSTWGHTLAGLIRKTV